MKKQTITTLSSKIALRSRSQRNRQNEEPLTPYCEVVNYLLEAYVTDDVIAKTDAEIMGLSQQLNKTLIEYAKLLWAKALRCNPVYDKYVLKGDLIEGLQHSIHQSLHLLQSSSKHATVQDLTRHVASLYNLENGYK